MARLNTSAAFHTSRMQPALQGWSAFLTERCAMGEVGALRRARVVANVDALDYPAEGRRAIAQRLTAQMPGKVRWIGCCERLYELGARIFVEVGPGSVLTRMMAQNLAGRPHLALSTDPGEADAQAHLAGLLAQLAVHGLALPAESTTNPGTTMQAHTINHLVSDFYQQNSQLLDRYFGLAERIIESGHSTPDVLRSFLDQGAQLTSAHLDANLRGLQLMRGGAAVLEPAPVIPALAPVAAPVPAPAPVITAPAASPLESWLRAAIGEATGFPAEAIDPHTRFEDLGIDSLAFTELFTSLTGQFPQAREHAKELFGAQSIAAILAIMAPPAEAPAQEAAQDDSVEGWLRAEIARLTGFPAASIDAGAAFDDLGIDSLAFTELFTSLTGRYPQARSLAKELYQARTLGAVCQLLAPAEQAVEVVAASAGRSPQLQAMQARILDVLRTMRPDAAIDDATSFESLNLNVFERQTLWQSTALTTSPYLLAGEALMPVDSVGEALDLLARMERRSSSRAELPGIDTLCRYVQVERARALPSAQPLPARVLLVGAGDALARRFEQCLGAAGVAVQTLTLDAAGWHAGSGAPLALDDHRALAGSLGRLRGSGEAMPILFLTAQTGDALERNATGMFVLAKALAGSQSARAAHGHLGVILTGGANPHEAGARGVARSLSHEWRDGGMGISSLVLADADNADPADSLRILLANDGVHDLTLRGGVLYQREAVPAPLGESAGQAPALDGDSVVLLCGGGVGIGAEVAVDLARRHGCAIVALGRTSWDGVDPYPQVKNDADLASAVYDDVKQAAGERKVSLAEVQEATQQARRRRALAHTAERVTGAGGRFMYIGADATNEHDLARAVAQVNSIHGRIDVVVHCAGTVEDKRVEDKPVESFRRVLHAKALSALHLQRALEHCKPRHVVLFSSLVSHTGNAGQSDYCAANEVLNALAQHWPGRGQDLRVSSMLWSVWTETGLASRGVQALMERHAMAGISSSDGARYFHDELATGAREPWTLIASPRTLDVMARGALLS
jgi:NAD(P)-dependent dehydrogenase (short-subunit alcohol dehydrogenase family)/acyl carrier protein